MDQEVKLTMKKKVDHDHSFFHVMYFGSPHSKIVSCDETDIRIWETGKEELKCVHVIKEHTKWPDTVMNWDNEYIISCGYDGVLLVIDINPPYRIVHRYEVKGHPLYNMLRINDDEFICVGGRKTSDEGTTPNAYVDNFRIPVFSFSKKTVVRKLDPELYFHWYSKLVLSKTHLGCFYVNSGGKKRYEHDYSSETPTVVHMVNHDDGKVTKKFTCDEQYEYVYSIVTLINARKEELLFFAGTKNKCYIHNTHKEKSLLQKVEMNGTGSIFNVIRIGKSIIGFGDAQGYLCLLREKPTSRGEETENEKFEMFFNTRVHTARIKFLDTMELRKDFVRLVTCSLDNTIQISEITGLRVRIENDEQSMKDLWERVEFIKEEMENSGSEIFDGKEYCVVVVLPNTSNLKHFKSLFV